MVWVYGGGFAFGKKGQDGNPAGLLAQSQQVDPEGRGIIYVQFNYRVSRSGNHSHNQLYQRKVIRVAHSASSKVPACKPMELQMQDF